MSKKALAGIIIACIVVIAAVIIVNRPTPTYTLSVTASPSGAGSVSPDWGEYESGAKIQLTATPTSGYQFVSWEGDAGTIGDIKAASTTITMKDSYLITANFVAQYELTVVSTDGGEVTAPGEGVFAYGDGSTVDLLAEPEEGYRFVKWVGDAGTIASVKSASTTLMTNDNYSITAEFAHAIDYSVFGKLTRIEADPNNGFHWAYYLYVPLSLRPLVEENCMVYLLVEPNNTGFVSDDQRVHDTEARALANRRSGFVEQLQVPLLIPAFPRPETAPLYTHALDRNTMLATREEWKRMDLQLVSMFDDASNRLCEKGVTTHGKMLMMGYSASGMFVSRFVVMHPDLVQAAAIGAPGGWPIVPLGQWNGVSLTYPVGTADLEKITGTEFDIDELRVVSLYFYIGDMDTNDSVPGPRGWSQAHKQLVFQHFGRTPVERWPIVEQMYEFAGCNSQFVLYSAVGHSITSAMLADIESFFLDNMEPR